LRGGRQKLKQVSATAEEPGLQVKKLYAESLSPSDSRSNREACRITRKGI
jgi:hypothetical protein